MLNDHIGYFGHERQVDYGDRSEQSSERYLRGYAEDLGGYWRGQGSDPVVRVRRAAKSESGAAMRWWRSLFGHKDLVDDARGKFDEQRQEIKNNSAKAMQITRETIRINRGLNTIRDYAKELERSLSSMVDDL